MVRIMITTFHDQQTRNIVLLTQTLGQTSISYAVAVDGIQSALDLTRLAAHSNATLELALAQ